jgi:hypothetical protein
MSSLKLRVPATAMSEATLALVVVGVAGIIVLIALVATRMNGSAPASKPLAGAGLTTGTAPSTLPGPLTGLPPPPPPPQSSSSPTMLTTDQAKAWLADPATRRKVVVAMEGCPACTMLRNALASLNMPADTVGVLLQDAWRPVADQLPAAQVPQLYTVGGGAAPVKGPTGFGGKDALSSLAQYLRQ